MSKKNNKHNLQQSTYYVRGMHCASCEVLIEKALIKKDGVTGVDVSLKDRKLTIWHHSNAQFNVEMLNEEFKDLHYTFSTNKNEDKKQWNLKTVIIGGSVFMSLIILFNLFEGMQAGKYMSVDATSSLAAFFILGLFAGASSCAALVGGILLSMTKHWNEQYSTGGIIERSQPHILFHAGRIISYMLLGGLLGALGNAITFDNVTVYAILILIVSVIMILLGLQMLGVTWAQRLRLALPRSVSQYVSTESNFSGSFSSFALGAGTFFLPCGFTLLAQGVALISGSFLAGSLIMGLFALGTLPILLIISLSGVWFSKKPHWTARFNIIAGALVLFFGLYNINAQLNVLGFPSLSSVAKDPSQQEDLETSNAVIEDGTQILRVVARDFEYIPLGSMDLRAGEPTTLLVDNQGVLGCGQFMAARGLIDGWVDLKPGKNEILFTPKKGTYKLTCTMGMVPPVTITVN